MEPDTRPAALFFIPTLEAGGAERVCVHYVNDLKAFRPTLMLQFRRGELLSELAGDVPLLEINTYTGYGEQKARRRRRLHREMRRRRRRLQVRGRHLVRTPRRWRWSLRRRRRILQVRWRYAERRTRAVLKARLGRRAVRAIQESERALRRVAFTLRWIAAPLLVLLGLLVGLLRLLLSLIAAPLRMLMGLAAFPLRPTRWGVRLRARPSSWIATQRLPSTAWFRLVLDCLFLVRQARLLTVSARDRRSELLVSFLPLTNVIAIFSKILFDRKRKVVINVHSVKSRLLEDASAYDRFLIEFLVRRFYGKADRIIAVAEGIKRDLVSSFGVPERKIQVIHNPIDLERIRRMAREEVDHPWIAAKAAPLVVAVGRLVKVKGFDLLIRAFSELPPAVASNLMIVGEGEEREPLQRLVERLGLERRVALVGFQRNPWKFMAGADCLVLSSRTEGLPNVIGEALALDLPILAVDCSLGVREYLQDGRYGLIVPPDDPVALARGLERLLGDERLRRELAGLADERVRLFARPRIVGLFENALREVAQS